MSSNKTVIPGMEGAYSSSETFGYNRRMNESERPQNGTSVPGMSSTPSMVTKGEKPIIGFLYSISKSNVGEYWPLHIGSNSIGRSRDCDVCLGEATVSDQHAVLVVRMMKNPEKIIASVCDARSTCGTMINGESLGFEPRECFNGDIITIGEHYDMLFILIDAKQIGLNVCRDFMPTQQAAPSHNVFMENQQNFVTPQKTDATRVFPNPYAAPAAPADNGFTHGDTGTNSGTAGGQEQDNRPKQGGTIFM